MKLVIYKVNQRNGVSYRMSKITGPLKWNDYGLFRYIPTLRNTMHRARAISGCYNDEYFLIDNVIFGKSIRYYASNTFRRNRNVLYEYTYSYNSFSDFKKFMYGEIVSL